MKTGRGKEIQDLGGPEIPPTQRDSANIRSTSDLVLPHVRSQARLRISSDDAPKEEKNIICLQVQSDPFPVSYDSNTCLMIDQQNDRPLDVPITNSLAAIPCSAQCRFWDQSQALMGLLRASFRSTGRSFPSSSDVPRVVGLPSEVAEVGFC